MIYEEKILDYLDGALGDKESAELMHQLAVSPERRVILEQHLQLKNVIGDARKPVPVPAAIEAKLAERIPVIASYNRELAGATFVATASRSPFFGRVAAGLVGLLLIGSVYFGLIRNSGDEVSDASGTDGTNVTNSSGTNTSEVSGTSSQAIQSASEVAGSSSQVSSESNAVARTGSGSGTANGRATSSGRSSGRQFIQPLSASDLPPHGGPVNDNTELIQQDIPLVDETLHQSGTVSAIDRLHTEPMPALYAPAEMTLAALSLEDRSSALPLALRVDYSLGASYNQMREADASLTTRDARAFAVGIDYILSPYFSLGVEGGQTDVSRVEEVATVVDDEELGIKRVSISHDIRSHTELNARAMVRYTVNPYSRLRWEVSLGGGAAVNDNVSPLVSLAITGSLPLTEAISLSGSVVYTGIFTQSGVSGATVDAVNGPVAYSATDRATSTTLFTPSVLGKVGLRIRPW